MKANQGETYKHLTGLMDAVSTLNKDEQSDGTSFFVLIDLQIRLLRIRSAHFHQKFGEALSEW